MFSWQSQVLLSPDDHRLRQSLPLTCEALLATQEKFAFTAFERTFKEFGLPQVIGTDKGVPFASAHAIYGLSKLAVWWLRLGIQIERIRPGHPEQNGPHERMHLTLKRDATKPAAPNVLQQQARFDDFVTRYNTDRPHLLQNDAWDSWQTPEEILLARFFKFSVQWDF